MDINKNQNFNVDFKTLALMVETAISQGGFGKMNTYDLLSVTHSLYDQMLRHTPEPSDPRQYLKTGELAYYVQAFIGNQRKIHAIKMLRHVTGCGLKEAKDAVEEYCTNTLAVDIINPA